MKAFYLTGSIISTVLILLLAFGNIAAQCSNLVFFFTKIDAGPTMVFLAIAVLGIITGAFYHAFIGKILGTSTEGDDEF